MNRLKLNEGGQPVHLDDLETLQDNDKRSMRLLLDALTGGAEAFLLKRPEKGLWMGDYDEGNGSYTLKGGTLVVDGEFLEWPETRVVTLTAESPTYLCVRETETDSRTFEDGQQRNCMVTKEVYATGDPTGAEKSYELDSLPVLADLMKAAIGA